ncbi:MAG: HNH endonuclease [Bacilli bacterium]|nr:HNH endonuclease [Bacilli bacterium]
MCGKSDLLENLEIDHIIPIARGGKTTPDNLQVLCHDCNKKKGHS